LTSLTFFALGGRLMRGRGEPRIAASSASAGGYRKRLAGGCKIEDLFACIGVIDDCPDRHRKLYARAVAPGAVASFSVAATLGRVFGIEAKVEQRIVVLARHQRDIAAAAAVPPARSAFRNEFLPPECRTPVTSVSGFDGNNYFIDKHERNLTKT
jgi:hypothetical protein